MKTAKYIQIAIFFLVPMILLLGSIVTPDRESSQRENRTLAQLPKLTAASIFSGDYMTRFEKYMSDQVMGRDGFVAAKTFLNRATGKTEQNGVYIGKDGWLFEKPGKYDEEKVSETVDAIRSFCEESEIENRAFVLVPNSSEIITDKLPNHLSFDSQAEQIRKIYACLPEKVKCIDAEGALENEENPEKLYYKSDHHWTSYGAKSVFNTIAKCWELDVDSVNYQTYALSDSFFGTLSSSSGIYEQSDVGLASFGFYKAGVYYSNSSLKAYECLAKGLPLATGCSITGVDKECPFVFSFPNNKSVVDIGEIVDKFEKLRNNGTKSKEDLAKEIRTFAEKKFSMEIVMRSIIDYINE